MRCRHSARQGQPVKILRYTDKEGNLTVHSCILNFRRKSGNNKIKLCYTDVTMQTWNFRSTIAHEVRIRIIIIGGLQQDGQAEMTTKQYTVDIHLPSKDKLERKKFNLWLVQVCGLTSEYHPVVCIYSIYIHVCIYIHTQTHLKGA